MGDSAPHNRHAYQYAETNRERGSESGAGASPSGSGTSQCSVGGGSSDATARSSSQLAPPSGCDEPHFQHRQYAPPSSNLATQPGGNGGGGGGGGGTILKKPTFVVEDYSRPGLGGVPVNVLRQRSQHLAPDPTRHDDEDDHDVGLKRTLGLPGAFSMVAGIVIGSGIFLSPVGIVEQLKSPFASLAVWVMCGAIATIGGICYVELATMLKKGAGDFTYIYAAFGRLPAFMFLWVIITVIAPTSLAILAMTFSAYLLDTIQLLYQCHRTTGDVPTLQLQLIASAIILVIVTINCANVEWASKVQILFTGAKVFSLLAIIGVGMYSAISGNQSIDDDWTAYGDEDDEERSIFYLPDAVRSRTMMGWIGAFALAFYNGVFSYAGWNNVTYATEEIKQPARTLPKAILLAIPCITVLYVSVNCSYFAVLSVDELLSSTAVAVTFAQKFYAPSAWVAAGAVLLSCFGSLNGCFYVVSRLCFVGAKHDLLPRILATVHIHRSTPIPAILLLCAATHCYIAVGGNIHILVEYESFVELLLISLTVLGLLVLRQRKPYWPRPYRVPLALPIIFLSFTTFTMIVSMILSWKSCAIGLLIVASGVPVHHVVNNSHRLPLWLMYRWARAQVLVQRLLLVAPEQVVVAMAVSGQQQPTPAPTMPCSPAVYEEGHGPRDQDSNAAPQTITALHDPGVDQAALAAQQLLAGAGTAAVVPNPSKLGIIERSQGF